MSTCCPARRRTLPRFSPSTFRPERPERKRIRPLVPPGRAGLQEQEDAGEPYPHGGLIFASVPKRGVCRECAKRQIRRGVAGSCTRPRPAAAASSSNANGSKQSVPCTRSQVGTKTSNPSPPPRRTPGLNQVNQVNPPRAAPGLVLLQHQAHPTRHTHTRSRPRPPGHSADHQTAPPHRGTLGLKPPTSARPP